MAIWPAQYSDWDGVRLMPAMVPPVARIMTWDFMECLFNTTLFLVMP
jgi:translation initiation factor IF-3